MVRLVIIVMLWTSNVIAKREARQLAFGSRLSEIDRPRSKVYTLVSDTHGTDDEAAVFEYDPDKSNQFRRSLVPVYLGNGRHVSIHHDPHDRVQHQDAHLGVQDVSPAIYNFKYLIDDHYSGSNFGHSEERNGDLTTGSYFVNLPDGRTQKVTYTVDAYGGYQAKVSYEGEIDPTSFVTPPPPPPLALAKPKRVLPISYRGPQLVPLDPHHDPILHDQPLPLPLPRQSRKTTASRYVSSPSGGRIKVKARRAKSRPKTRARALSSEPKYIRIPLRLEARPALVEDYEVRPKIAKIVKRPRMIKVVYRSKMSLLPKDNKERDEDHETAAEAVDVVEVEEEVSAPPDEEASRLSRRRRLNHRLVSQRSLY